MAITQRTAEEAKVYIVESLKQWEEANESKKIISLAAFAEKWHSSKGASPIAKMKSLQLSIKALKLILKRNEKIDLPSGQLEDQVKYLEDEYKELADKYGEPKTKIKKTLLEKANVD
jgi:hypothetical protein